jgi:hypothetical protein
MCRRAPRHPWNVSTSRKFCSIRCRADPSSMPYSRQSQQPRGEFRGGALQLARHRGSGLQVLF